MRKLIFSATVVSLVAIIVVMTVGCKGKSDGPTDLSTLIPFYVGKSYAIELTYAGESCNVDMTGMENLWDHTSWCDPLLATLTIVAQDTQSGAITVEYSEYEGSGCDGWGWYAWRDLEGCQTYTATGSIDYEGNFSVSGIVSNDCNYWDSSWVPSGCLDTVVYLIHIEGRISGGGQVIEGTFSFQDNDPYYDVWYGDCNPWDGPFYSKFCCEDPPQPLDCDYSSTWPDFPDGVDCLTTWEYLSYIDTCYYNETFTGTLLTQ